MASSGKGDYPFRSVWLQRTGVYGGTYLRKTIIPGHGTDVAGRTVWSDWFFSTPTRPPIGIIIVRQAVNRAGTY